MLKKLSTIEKSRLYAAVADLENAYGAERVEKAVGQLVNALDGGSIRTGGIAAAPVQMELLPFEEVKPQKPRKQVFNRKAPGVNKKKIKEYFDDYIKRAGIHYETGEEALVKLYYVDGKTQDEIAAMVGVKQRAISQYLFDIPERKKTSIIKYWAGGKENGFK